MNEEAVYHFVTKLIAEGGSLVPYSDPTRRGFVRGEIGEHRLTDLPVMGNEFGQLLSDAIAAELGFCVPIKVIRKHQFRIAGRCQRRVEGPTTDARIVRLLDDHPFLALIVDFMESKPDGVHKWKCRALQKQLTEFAKSNEMRRRFLGSLPSGAQQLSRKLGVYDELLLDPFSLTFTREKSGERYLILTKKDAESVHPSNDASGATPDPCKTSCAPGDADGVLEILESLRHQHHSAGSS